MRLRRTITAFLFLGVTSATVFGDDPTRYVDPRIGNVSTLLVPTYPTFSLPNQMLRMIPDKASYIDDQIAGFPLQIPAHRNAGVLPMKVSLGAISAESWTRKMSIDHDLEVMHPWHYSTSLIEDDIRVSFSPARKAAIFRIDFPAAQERNLLFAGSEGLKSAASGPGGFSFEEFFSQKGRGPNPAPLSLWVYGYGEITDLTGRSVAGIRFETSKRGFSITLPREAPPSVLVKYGISYISAAQARKNFETEVTAVSFDELVAKGRAAWGQALGQLAVEGGTEAQRRSFYTALN